MSTLLKLKLFSMTKYRKDFQKPTSPATTAKDSILAKGKLVYANNGERGQAARNNPFTPSGVLATNGLGPKRTLSLSFAACSPQRLVIESRTGSRIKHACLRAPAIILAPIYVEADALVTVCMIPE
jgi:hypothetical protein